MRCRRAQQWMTVTEALAPRRRRALERHVAGCTSCQAEQTLGAQLDAALGILPHEHAVPASLEQATFRAVRLAAAAEEERPARSLAWWLGTMGPALAGAAALVLAVGLYWTGTPGTPSSKVATTPGGSNERLATPAVKAVRADTETARAAKTAPAPGAVAARGQLAGSVFDEPPPDLAAMPERFMDLPVLRNLDKLRHYEAITGVVDDFSDPGQALQSDG